MQQSTKLTVRDRKKKVTKFGFVSQMQVRGSFFKMTPEERDIIDALNRQY